MYDFNYHRPATMPEAAALLTKAEDGKLIAGGQTLIPTLKQRLAQPSDLIDLGAIEELKTVKEEGGNLVLGSMVTHAAVATSDLVARLCPVLNAVAHGIGDPQVRNRGTIGGSIANNDPAADYPAALLGLGATIVTTTRELSADDFFTGMFETALEEKELIRFIKFPQVAKAAYSKFPNPASRYAIVGVMVARVPGGLRVAVTGAGPGVFRWAEAEAALTANFAPDALDGVAVDADGMNADIHASSEYRAHLVRVMAKRAVAAAA